MSGSRTSISRTGSPATWRSPRSRTPDGASASTSRRAIADAVASIPLSCTVAFVDDERGGLACLRAEVKTDGTTHQPAALRDAIATRDVPDRRACTRAACARRARGGRSARARIGSRGRAPARARVRRHRRRSRRRGRRARRARCRRRRRARPSRCRPGGSPASTGRCRSRHRSCSSSCAARRCAASMRRASS